jgi:hypothetical protein
MVHQLVLEAFVGPRPRGMESCHNNGNQTDNRLVNLRWDTKSENNLDRVRHGTHSESSKKLCPRGHWLVVPNLVEAYLKKGRVCWSCRRALQKASSARRRGQPVPDADALADELYARRMAEAG